MRCEVVQGEPMVGLVALVAVCSESGREDSSLGVVLVNLKGRRRTLGIAPEVTQES